MGPVEEAGQGVGYSGGDASDDCGLDGAAEPAGANELSFQRAEDGQGQERDDNRELESFGVVGYEHVGQERDEAPGDVGECDGGAGAMGTVGGRLFEAEFETHHEIDPCGGVLLESVEYGGGGRAVDGVLLEDLVDLFLLVMGAFDDFSLFASAFGDVVFSVSAGGEVAAEAHGDGAGGYLGQAGKDYDVGGSHGS